MFDIRNYECEEPSTTVEVNGNKGYWGPTFVKYLDDSFPAINRECSSLIENMTPNSEGAFHDKLKTWKRLVTVVAELDRLYKIENPKCVLKEN